MSRNKNDYLTQINPEKDEQDWLTKHHDGEQMIEHGIHELESLASHFYAVGNQMVSDQLYDIAKEISVGLDNVWEAVIRALHILTVGENG